jgi:hypothetical protein
MTAAEAPQPTVPEAPLRTALELSGNLAASAFAAFKRASPTLAQVAEDRCKPLAARIDPYYQPVANRLNENLFTVDAKLNEVLSTVVATCGEVKAKRLAPLLEQATELKDKRLTPLLEQAHTHRLRLSEYSTEVVSNANESAKQAFESQVARTREALHKLLETMQRYSAEIEARLPYSNELRARITALLRAAMELSQQSRSYLNQHRLQITTTIQASTEPARAQLAERLEFVATEIESRLLSGDVAQDVKVQSLVERVQGLLLAASETIGKATAAGVRGAAKMVKADASGFAVEEPASEETTEEAIEEATEPKQDEPDAPGQGEEAAAPALETPEDDMPTEMPKPDDLPKGKKRRGGGDKRRRKANVQ